MRLSFGLFVLLFIILFGRAVASADQAAAIAKIYTIEGTASVKQGDKVIQAAVGDELFPGQTISVDRESRVGIEFTDGTFVRLGSLATLTLREREGTASLALESGFAHFLSRDPVSHPVVDTPTVTAAIRGTEFTIAASASESIISVLEGQVSATNKLGSALLSAGESARIKKNEPPVKDTTILLKDSVQWTAYIPFLANWSEYGSARAADDKFNVALHRLDAGEDIDADNFKGDEALFLKAARRAQGGDLKGAGEVLKDAKGSLPEVALLKGRIALSTGDVSRGKAQLAAVVLDSRFASSAHASLALAALSEGDLETARRQLDAARDQKQPSSFSAAAVASLLCQAERNIPCALQEAKKLLADSEYARVRKAEILFALGDIDGAREMIRSAQPSPYRDVVEGFLFLASMERDKAETRFQRASKEEPGAAMPRLGLALVSINRNDLEHGRELLLEAAQLEPNNSMVRSYLGKLFSEAWNEKLARREYGEAIRLDPNDPTPWLYRSYTDVSENRPVDALNDVNESIKRNANRAVFRSSLYLDQDLAQRTANLSQVYRDLGFTELGRIEAIKALALDYRNYSAHRMLSDLEDTLFLADASLSERREADILAPLSLNLLDSVGSSTSFGDYTGLYDRDETKTVIGGQYFSDRDFYSPYTFVAGKHGHFGYAASVEAVSTNGSAHNNTDQDYRISGELRYQPTYDTRIGLRGFGQYVRNDDSNEFEQHERFRRFRFELEGTHEIGAGTSILLHSEVERQTDYARQFGGQDTILSTQIFQGASNTLLDDIIYDRSRRGLFTITQNEFQIINEIPWLSSIFGGTARTEHRNESEDSFVVDDSLGELAGNNVHLPSSGLNDLKSYNLYLYETFHPIREVQLTAALTYDRVERELRDVAPFISGTHTEEQLSPKFGVLATPVHWITLHGSWGESLAKSSFQDEFTLEPTQVSGITQRFNDLPGTRARAWGGGIDISPVSDTHFGGELIRRRLSEPFDDAVKEFVVNFDQGTIGSDVQLGNQDYTHIDQDFARAYLYQIFTRHFVGAIDYHHTMQRITDPDIFGRVSDQTFSSTLRYFFDSGIFALVRGSWRHQDRLDEVVVPDGRSSAWLFDAGIGYRIPNRRGFVSLEVDNLFDKKIVLEQLSGLEPFIASDTVVALKANVVF